MDKASTNLRTMKENRDAVFAFYKRLDDLRKEIVAASDELKIMRRDELSHYNDDAQGELRKALNLLWESQHNLSYAANHTVKAHSAHYQRLG